MRITLIFTTIILIVSAILAVHHQALSKEDIELISNLISSIGTIITIYVAILLYDRFGIDRELKLKSFETVSKLIASFQSKRLSIESHFNNQKAYCFIRFNDKDLFSDCEYLDAKLYFHSSAIEALSEMCSIKSDVLLPPEIAKALSAFEIIALRKITTSDCSSNYCVIKSTPSTNKLFVEEGVYLMDLQTPITAKEFIANYKKLKLSIIDWVKDNTSDSQKLNLQI